MARLEGGNSDASGDRNSLIRAFGNNYANGNYWANNVPWRRLGHPAGNRRKRTLKVHADAMGYAIPTSRSRFARASGVACSNLWRSALPSRSRRSRIVVPRWEAVRRCPDSHLRSAGSAPQSSCTTSSPSIMGNQSTGCPAALSKETILLVYDSRLFPVARLRTIAATGSFA
jgi:hypothetical protein